MRLHREILTIALLASLAIACQQGARDAQPGGDAPAVAAQSDSAAVAVGDAGADSLAQAAPGTESLAPSAAGTESVTPSAAAQEDVLEPAADAPYARPHREMIEDLQAWGIADSAVLAAMARVSRHEFVADAYRDLAYDDTPLPIGLRQTISAPSIVALMTELVHPRPDAKALDVGTGSGYQAAVLAELVEHVYSIEILCPLADQARERLERLGYTSVTVRCGDGYRGWPEEAPFDLIILAAAPDHIPQPLVEQLAPGGRLVLPVGDLFQELILVEKRPDGTVEERSVLPVRFVPMTGEAEGHEAKRR